MQFRSNKVWQWALGIHLAVGGTLACAQSSVPDAPTPQTLPQLNSITPTAPAIDAPAPSNAPPAPSAPTANTGTGTLPAAPVAQTQPNQDADADQGPPPADNVFKLGQVTVNLVDVPFTVKDSSGHLVPGLTARDVQIYENGLRQRPAVFEVDPAPLSVALVIDQSVTFDTMQKINASLSALQGAFTKYDEVSIFTYNNGVRQVTGLTGAQSTRLTFALDRSKAPGREPNLAMGGPLACTTCKNNLPIDPNTNGNNTAGVIMQTPEREFHTLNDAILTAAESLAHAAPGRLRVVYVISDGKEYGSKAKQKEVIRYLQTNSIAVYGTLVGDTAVPGLGFLSRIHLPLQMRDDVLPRYADQTGGQCDPEFRPRGIQDSFAKLAEQVRTQYRIYYYSHEPFIDAKYRSIDVRVLRPNMEVIAKPGYFPKVESNPSRATTARSVGPASEPTTQP